MNREQKDTNKLILPALALASAAAAAASGYYALKNGDAKYAELSVALLIASVASGVMYCYMKKR